MGDFDCLARSGFGTPMSSGVVETGDLVEMIESGDPASVAFVVENSDPDSDSIIDATPAVCAQKRRNHNSGGSSESLQAAEQNAQL
jgi:hypothetical protein